MLKDFHFPCVYSSDALPNYSESGILCKVWTVSDSWAGMALLVVGVNFRIFPPFIVEFPDNFVTVSAKWDKT